MSTHDPDQPNTSIIRETYEEYKLGAATVAMIADPQNTHAWIQSTTTAGVEP